MIVHPALIALPAAFGLSAANASQILKRKPGATPAGEALEQLGGAFAKRVDDIKPGAKPVTIGLGLNTPESFAKDFTNLSKYTGNQRGRTPGEYNIFINPNTDRSYLAHELGHIASDQTDIGRMIRTARDSKMAQRALLGAGLTGAGATALATPGDEDLIASIALASSASLPTILDEVLATKNGLAIMDIADMRANLGQRGRLAGGLLSYIAAPVLAGASMNLLANQFDEDVTLGM